MFTQYFGNYLYEAGIITLKAYQESLLQMKDKRARLGVLAIEAGCMTPSQVEETFHRQQQVDKKFGEIAVSEGYMTAVQLEDLLQRQSSPFAVFSQIMIDSGAMTYSRLSELLESYREKCGLSAESFKQFQEGDLAPVIEKLIPGRDALKDKVARSYLELFFRNVARLVNENVTLGDGQTPLAQVGWMACQQMRGTLNVTTSFSGDTDALCYFSGGFAKAVFAEFDPMARDVLGEFLNCTNGIFTANALELGVNLDLDPQFVTDDVTRAQSDDMVRIQFSIENYKYQLNVAF